MITKKMQWMIAIVLVALILISSVSALAATNIVPGLRMSDQSFAAPASELAPPECDSIRSALTSIVVCSGGNCNGTQGNDLILGSPNADNIKGKNGNDCIVGGAGDDSTLSGDNGTDVCIGGPGNDSFKKCETEIQ